MVPSNALKKQSLWADFANVFLCPIIIVILTRFISLGMTSPQSTHIAVRFVFKYSTFIRSVDSPSIIFITNPPVLASSSLLLVSVDELKSERQKHTSDKRRRSDAHDECLSYYHFIIIRIPDWRRTQDTR